MSTLLQILLLGPLLKRDEGKQVGILPVHPNPQDLLSIAELFDAGKVIPVIDKTYPLDEVPQALQYLGDGRSQGKVVITIAHE